jgi:hypothetical protein
MNPEERQKIIKQVINSLLDIDGKITINTDSKERTINIKIELPPVKTLFTVEEIL